MSFELRGVCPLLFVFDMSIAIRFYRDVLGFQIVQRSQPTDDCGWAWLRRDGAEVMLNTMYDPDAPRPSAPEPTRVAGHGDTVLYFGCPDVDGAYQDLRARGLDVQPPSVTDYGMRQLHLTDPDGFGLCFQWPATHR